MIGREFKFHNGQRGAALAIRLVTEKPKNRIKKVQEDGTVLVEIAGIPDHPRKALLAFIANELSIDPSKLDIIEGKEGTDLILSFLDYPPDRIQEMILEKIS